MGSGKAQEEKEEEEEEEQSAPFVLSSMQHWSKWWCSSTDVE